MFLYFNKNGQLVEIINDDVPHKGSIDYDKIFVYVDGYNVFPNTLWTTFEASDGTRSIETQVSLGEPKEIPFNKKRDLKCFEYFKKYSFFEVSIPENISAIDGLTLFSARLGLDNDTIKALDIVPFEIKNNLIGGGDICITDTQYNYLIKLVNDFGQSIEKTIIYHDINELNNINKAGVYHLVYDAVEPTSITQIQLGQIMLVLYFGKFKQYTQVFIDFNNLNNLQIKYRTKYNEQGEFSTLKDIDLSTNGITIYNPNVTYKKGAIINYRGINYIALQYSLNQTPSESSEYWYPLDNLLIIESLSELDNVTKEGFYRVIYKEKLNLDVSRNNGYFLCVNSYYDKNNKLTEATQILFTIQENKWSNQDYQFRSTQSVENSITWASWDTIVLTKNGYTMYNPYIRKGYEKGAIVTFNSSAYVHENKTGAYLSLKPLNDTTPVTSPNDWLYLNDFFKVYLRLNNLESNLNNILVSIGQPKGIATLDENGKVEATQLPDITISAEKLKPYFVGDDTIIVDLTETNDQIEIHLDQIYKESLATKTYVNDAISGISSFNIKIVATLPDVGETNTFYFVKKVDAKVNDTYEEYMYIENKWELLGSTKIDLSDYAKTSYVDTELAKKVSVATERSIVHGTNAQGQETTIAYNKDAIGGGLAQRNNDGTLMVATPTQDNDATTKKYVDDKAKSLMSKHTYIGDIYLNEFFRWCENTPSIVDGALFKVETETETPQDALSRGFPLLQANSVLYGYFYNGMDESPIVIMTDKGNYKITNGASDLTCEKLGGGEAVTINQPSTATNGNLSSLQLAILKKSDLNYIVFANEMYYLMDKTHTTDTLTYSHLGYENNKHQVKTISITISTLAWVLNETEIGGTDVLPNNGQPTTAILTTLKVGNTNYALPSGGGKLIEFSIDGTTYSAIENMTFEEWVNSKLNTNGYVVSGNYIQNKEKTAFIENIVKDTPIEAQAYNLIVKFYIDLISYKAPLDTTWETWVNSPNNTGGFKVKPDENDIFTSDFSKVIKGVSKEGIITIGKYETWVKPKAVILGVSGEAQSNSKLTRTDDAVGLNVIVPESGAIQSNFDNVAPYSDIKEVPDGKGNIFVRIPKFYTQYTIESDGTKTTKICTVKLDDTWKLNPCFKDESGNELPYIDVGKYIASGTSTEAKSVSGASPLVDVDIQDLRTACMNNGSGYQQFDIWTHEMLATLFKIEFATTNSQSIMYGYLNNNSNAIASGNCDSLGVNKSGSNGSNTDGKRPMTYRGIENLYGNVYQWVDGINFRDDEIYVNEKPSTYKSDTFTGDYKKVGYQKIQQEGYIKKLGYEEMNSFIALPIEVGGSNSTYYGDFYYQSGGTKVLSFGSPWYYGLGGGLWDLRSNDYSYYFASSYGGRLVRKAII